MAFEGEAPGEVQRQPDTDLLCRGADCLQTVGNCGETRSRAGNVSSGLRSLLGLEGYQIDLLFVNLATFIEARITLGKDFQMSLSSFPQKTLTLPVSPVEPCGYEPTPHTVG